jgi:hypothetical protein
MWILCRCSHGEIIFSIKEAAFLPLDFEFGILNYICIIIFFFFFFCFTLIPYILPIVRKKRNKSSLGRFGFGLDLCILFTNDCKFVTCFFRICVMSGEEAICTGAKKNMKMKERKKVACLFTSAVFAL